MNNILNRYAPVLPIFGFIIQMEVYNHYDNFENAVKKESYKNFEIYDHLTLLVKNYYGLGAYTCNYYLISLFTSENKTITITGEFDNRFKIRLTYYPLTGGKTIKTMKDISNVINYLNELSLTTFIDKTPPTRGGRISTLGSND